jgi:hypothetical protein
LLPDAVPEADPPDKDPTIMNDLDQTLRLRRFVYALLITVAAGAAVGRILAVERVYEPTLHRQPGENISGRSDWPSKLPPLSPTFSSNDRSRWATIRALVDKGTYVIGERDPRVVLNTAVGLFPARNPLEESLLAIRGFQLRTASDRTIWRDPNERYNPDNPTTRRWEPDYDSVDKVMRPGTLDFYSSKPPLFSTLVAGLYWLLQQITYWTLAANVWEVVRTILLLVNVVPFLAYLMVLALLVERFGGTDWSRVYLMAAACFATLVTPFLITLNNHTPATFCVLFTLFPALNILCGNRQGERQGRSAPWYHFLLAGFFAALGACLELPAAAFAAGLGLILLLRAPGKTLLFLVPVALLPVAAFFVTNYIAIGQLQPAYSEFGGSRGSWYMYEGSHWSYPPGTRFGIDFARNKETQADYTFHVLIGHHGLFSLTPMWLLAFAGMFLGPLACKTAATAGRLPFYFFPASLLLSVIVIGFYLLKTDNYGGWTAGLRWLMWLTPVWLLCMLPVLDWLSARRWGRWLGYLLLAASVLSVSYPAWNPWRHPWLYRWMEAQQWIAY